MEKQKIRYNLLDELRGFAVLCMIFYHAFYTLYYDYGVYIAKVLYKFFTPFEPYFAVFFILLSGLCCHLSHSNLIRGLKLLGIAILISIITVFLMPKLGFSGAEIYFGILHLLSVGMLLFGLFGKYYSKINPYVTLIICVLIFALTYDISNGNISIGNFTVYKLPKSIYYNTKLFVFGFYDENFFSADYFPIFPWLFAFFGGASLGEIFKRRGFPNFFIRMRVKPLAFIGRHALIIYIIHQPIVLLFAYLITLF